MIGQTNKQTNKKQTNNTPKQRSQLCKYRLWTIGHVNGNIGLFLKSIPKIGIFSES